MNVRWKHVSLSSSHRQSSGLSLWEWVSDRLRTVRAGQRSAQRLTWGRAAKGVVKVDALWNPENLEGVLDLDPQAAEAQRPPSLDLGVREAPLALKRYALPLGAQLCAAQHVVGEAVPYKISS